MATVEPIALTSDGAIAMAIVWDKRVYIRELTKG